jgi:late competence protein required for DNA uptake (superfamily II DNA/RNA helicase)
VSAKSTLRQLHRIRQSEEEQAQMNLQAALGELQKLKDARIASLARSRKGRVLINASAASGELSDWFAGLEEIRATSRLIEMLSARITVVESTIARLRVGFMAKRIERRQAETLLEKIDAQNAVRTGRRNQDALDIRHLRESQRTKGNGKVDRNSIPHIGAVIVHSPSHDGQEDLS